MKTMAPAIALALLVASSLPAAAQPASGEGPELSETGWCVAFYNAFARARDRRARSPKAVREAAGFFSIDFRQRAAAARAKLAKTEDFAITYHQQGIEQAFDAAGHAEADGKSPGPDAGRILTLSLTDLRKCDAAHGFTPALLDRTAARPAPPVEPYGCAVNYFALGMGMKSNPEAQRTAMHRIGAAMARFDKAVAEDSSWRDIVRGRIQAEAAERNKAVGEGKVKPQDLFAFSQACDRLLASPA